ncbi:MAG TPA: hypothetical protein VGY90_06355 [Steroidobacteraceae bacterium]|jgi:hypothetical protein|nr:hypothetical protein [Steroidobacteraceae bacterium]
MKNIVVAGALSILMATAAYAYSITHPNLKDAYGLADQAIRHIQEAQQDAKGVEFGQHANKAIELFQQAENELVEADKWNNSHQKKPKQ